MSGPIDPEIILPEDTEFDFITYQPSEEDLERDENNFTYHSPHSNQDKKYKLIRVAVKGLVLILRRLCPPSRELSVAVTHIETAVNWANASIARNEKPKEDEEEG